MEIDIGKIIIENKIDLGNLDLDVEKLKPNVGEKSITDNGVYNAKDDHLDGYDVITVSVREPAGTINIIDNGMYDVKERAFANVTVNPLLEEKNVMPTKETNEIVPDQEFYGLSKVVVHPIPDEYIIPSGDLEIIENGTYDVTDKSNAIVTVPIPTLGTKEITKNGIYKASDDNLNGYSEVKVETSGVDIDDYFDRTPTTATTGTILAMIKKTPIMNMINRTSLQSFFSNLSSVLEIGDIINTNNVTNTSYMFNNDYMIETTPFFNTDNVINMSGMYSSCRKIISIPQYNTINVVNMNGMFASSYKLKSVPKLLGNSLVNVDRIFHDCSAFTDFGGLENLGQAYSTTQSANYSSYTLTLSSCTKLTYESLMNVINNLYDIKTAGVQTQKLVLGSTNKSKLTADEIAIATNKGWTVS